MDYPRLGWFVVSTACCLAPALAARGQDVTLPASIKAVDDNRVYATEAGILLRLPVREGDRVQAGEVLAKIDDRQVAAARRVAQYKYEAAEKRAEDDIELRYADAAGKVARIDWERDIEANESVPNSVPDIQLRQKKLVWQKAKLQYEKALNDQVLAGMDAAAFKAELEAAEIAVERRIIRAPFDGVVQTLFIHEAEWVNPGDPILRLVRLDKLYVETFVSSSEFDPSDLCDCPVTVTVTLARGRQVEVEGKIVFTDPIVAEGGDYDYRVRAEVANKQTDGFWELRPGLPAQMTLRLGAGTQR